MSAERERTPIVRPLGESAVLIQLPEADDYARVLLLAERLSQSRLHGVCDVTPAYGTLAVYFDPLVTTAQEVTAVALDSAENLTAVETEPVRLVTIPVTYDGPDLQVVAERTGLTPDEVVALHLSGDYQAQAIGFVPGFAYLGGLDPRLHLPRHDSPRTRVPAGSVAIAGEHTTVYPFETPGGWHLLGSTTTVLFDPVAAPPALLTVGTRVRFVPA